MLNKIEILDTVDVSSLSYDNDSSFDHYLKCTTQSDFIYYVSQKSLSYILKHFMLVWIGELIIGLFLKKKIKHDSVSSHFQIL